MPSRISAETDFMINPVKYAAHQNEKLLTPIKGEPPVNIGRGRRRNPVITKVYNELVTSKAQWYHLNIPITDKKQLNSIRTSLYMRARKDNFTLSTASLYNEQTKLHDLWVMLS